MSLPIGPFRKVPQGGGAKLPAFLPRIINPSFLELYVDSRNGLSSFADGAAVTLWPDFSGHSPARDAITNTVNPTMGRSGINLTPKGTETVVWKTGSDAQGLIGRTQFTWPLITTRGYTLHFYGLVEAKTTPVPYSFVHQSVWGGDTANFHLIHGINSGDGNERYGLVDDFGGGNPHRFGTFASISGKWVHHALVLPPPNNNTVPCKYFINGTQIAQTSGPANYACAQTGISAYSLGNAMNFVVALRGNIGAYFIYSIEQSAATIALFSTWADTFFGIT